MMSTAEPPAGQPRDWYGTNLVGVPAGLIGSTAFNEHPVRRRIHGTRESARGLFHLLDTAGSLAYIEEKMTSRFHNNCINQQLDLLYEFCQWAVRRFGLPGRGRIPVWRGVNGLQEHRRWRRGLLELARELRSPATPA